MKSKSSTYMVESETVREPPNAYEVLMPQPRTSRSPKKHQSPRPLPEDDIQKKIAKENRAANKKNLEVMSKNVNEKHSNKHSAVDNMVKMPKIVFLPSDSEDEQIDLKSMLMEKPSKQTANSARRKIMSDSESDANDSPKKNCTKADSPLQLQQSRLNFKPRSNVSKDEVNTKKRNSLLNYFNSVSREEAKKTAEQIKVKVHIHSPPTTPGRKPINQKSSPIESPRRSARMRLSYEMCDQIEVISSEIISAPSTPVKISLKKTEIPKVETPKRGAVRTPRKSPLKVKEKPEYVKNLKLKIKAPLKLIATTGGPVEKFILSPEALDELFLSPNPNKKGDKELKKQKKKKKVNLVECNDADASKSARKVIKTAKLTPKKTKTPSSKASPKKVIVTLKNSPRTKKAVSTSKSKSLSKPAGKMLSKRDRSSGPCADSATSSDATHAEESQSTRNKIRTPNKSPKNINRSDPAVTPKKKIGTTPKSLPRTKKAASASKSVSSTSKAIGKKTPSKREKSSVPDKSSLKTSGKAASKRERSSGSDASATNKSIAKTESPARPPRNSSFSAISPQVIKEIPRVKVAILPKSTKSPKSISRKNGEALSTEKSAFEEMMSKKKSHVSTSKEIDVTANSVSEIKKCKKSSSTLSKKESLKSDRYKVLYLATVKGSEMQRDSVIQSPSEGIRKSSRIPSSESRKARYEEVEEPVKQRPKNRKRKMESDDSEDDVILIEPKSKKHQSQSAKPPLKLAPMFMKRSSGKITEKIEDPAITEAKRRFLSSGVPECIKKVAEILAQPEQEVLIFPTIAHVKQEDKFPAWTLSEKDLELLRKDDTSFEVKIPPISPGTLMDQKSAAVSEQREPNLPRRIDTYRKVLNNLKLENPNYCVIRNYKRLKSKYVKSLPQSASEPVQAKRQKRVRKRKRSAVEVEVIDEPIIAQEPSLVWTEKYKPMSSEDVVGNITEVHQLKTWLESWKRFHKSDDPNYDIIKRKRSKSGSSEEFIEDDESGDEDNSQMPINTSLIFGPCGSGKTSAVYAVAHELGYKVLEINASSKRTGKHLLKLQEATQSHRVCAKNEAAESIAKMFAQPGKQKKKKKTKADKVLPKPSEGDEASNKMSLILIENADIIFEDEDEGFVAALVTLVQSSKRPVVMVANDSLCPHLSRFVEQSQVIDMDWPYPGHLCVWLQLVSLVEGVRISADAAQRLVGRFNGDVARCLNQLQFWTMTGGNNLENCSEALTSSLKDEESSDSMPTTERVEEGTPLHDRCIELFLGNTSCGLIPYPISLSEVWWNLAPVLSLPQPKSRRVAVEPYVKPRNPTERLNELFSELDGAVEEENIFDRLKRKNRTVDTGVICEEEVIKPVEKKIDVVVEKWVSVCSQVEVDSLAMLMDNLAAVDEMTSNPEMNGGTYDVGPCSRVWDRKPADGISGRLDFSLSRHREQAVVQSMAHFLVDRSVGICRDQLGSTGDEYDVSLPKWEDIRWLLEQQEADNTIVSLVPTNALVDHRATFVDYLPTLQSVCRHENTRLSTNTKRRNRFFHYLRGLGCHPSDEAVNVLCSTFGGGLWRCDDRAESDES